MVLSRQLVSQRECFFFLPEHFVAKIQNHQDKLIKPKPIQMYYAVSDVVLQQEAHV